MHYILQAIKWLEPLTLAVGAFVAFWAFSRCRKLGYLVVAIYFCLAVFSLLALPRIKAELRSRRSPALSQETQQKLSAAMNEAYERVMREQGAQPAPAELDIRFPLGPLVLVLGVWLLARREPRAKKSGTVSDTPSHGHPTA